MSKKLLSNIISASNKIANASRYGVGNYIICNQFTHDILLGIDKVYKRKQKLQKIMKNIQNERNKS